MGQLSCQSSRIPPILAPPCRCNTRYHLQSSIFWRSKIQKIPEIPIMNSWAVWGPKSFRTQKKCRLSLWGESFQLKKTHVLLPSLMMVCDWWVIEDSLFDLTSPTLPRSGVKLQKTRKTLGFCWFLLGVSWDGVLLPKATWLFPMLWSPWSFSLWLPMPLDNIVNQLIWQFTNQILAKTANPWGRKSLQKIRQHHQIWEEKKSTGLYKSCAVLDP